MKYVLGIDAGATKTHFVLADETGRVLSQTQTGPSNLHDIAATQITRMFSDAFTKLCRAAVGKTRVALDAVAVGWAGLDSLHDRRIAGSVMKHAFHHALPSAKRFAVVNDTIIGLWSGTTAKNAICVIGGTGSNGYGRNAKKKEAWAGGLGHIMADEGSGYEAGIKILHAAAKAEDGRGPETVLLPMVLESFGARSMRELVPIVYKPGFGKHQIGQIAYLVEKASRQGDAVAIKLAKESAHELVLIAQSVAQQLGFSKRTHFDLVTIGGFLKHDPIVSKSFQSAIRRSFPRAQLIVPAVDPVMGAVDLARSLL